MNSYYIEDCNGEIIEYTKTLTEAKEILQTMLGAYSANDLRIVALKGQYFGEGFHKYYLTYDIKNDKYKKELI